MAKGNDDATVIVGFDIDKFRQELAKVNGHLNSWASGLKTSLAGLGAGFSAIGIANFTLEVSKLAGETDGVKAAFDRLNDSVQLMTDLKKATNNTVSELELMKRAVMASNFDISLKALPDLLEFATLRAKQTGQSVDYLVDSIVTGIGRKSKLILDNLGISAVQLEEALGGASAASSTIGEVAEAVGRIAEANLKNMAGFTDDAKTSMDQLNASWENFKVNLGRGINEKGGLGLLKDASAIMAVLSDNTLGWTQKLEILATTFTNEGITEKLEQWKEKLDPIIYRQNKINEWKAQQLINQYGGINQALTALGEEWRAVSSIDHKEEIQVILNRRLKESIDSVTRGIEDEAKKAEALKKAYDEVFHSKSNLAFLNGQAAAGYASQGASTFSPLLGEQTTPVVGIPQFSSAYANINMPKKASLSEDIQKQVEANNVWIKGLENQVTQVDSISKEMEEILNSIGHGFAQLSNGILDAVENSIEGGDNLGVGLTKALANFAKSYGKQLVALGAAKVAESVVMKDSKGTGEGLALMAAGAALSLAGSAALASTSKGGGGGSHSSSSGHRSSINGNTQNLNVSGEFRIRGSDLVAAVAAGESNNYYRRGG